MGYTYNFKNNEVYSADDINSIRSSFVGKGVIGGETPALKVTLNEGKVFVSKGSAVFADGSILTVDDDGVELDFTENSVNYVYLLNDTALNKNTVNISTEMPVGDFVMLAEINLDGVVLDRRSYALAKYSVVGAQSCFLNFLIPGGTNNWDGSQFMYVGRLNVDRNLRAVTVFNKSDYNIAKQEIAFIHDSDVEMRVLNTNSSEDIDIRITPNYELWARAKINHVVSLLFTNTVEGTIEYA